MSGLRLRAQAGIRRGDGTTLVPPWAGPVFFACALVLVPWTAFLFLTLPRVYSANHWGFAWGGFDIGLGLALTLTALAVVRRSPFGEISATVTGTLLVCDAWFDVLTSRGTSDVAQAVASAVLIELPLAGLCFWIARNVARAVEVARPHLIAAGFAIRNHQLMPPTGHAGRPRDPNPPPAERASE